ncbi:MAG: hypothetical protein Q9217_006900 [Psora testacea]
MPPSPAELEMGYIPEEKSGLVQDLEPPYNEYEKSSVKTTADGLLKPSLARHRGRRSAKIFWSACAAVSLYTIFPFLLEYTPHWFNGSACRWLYLGYTACEPPAWYDVKPNPASAAEHPHVLKEIPQYVLDHAPYVHLYSEEQFWPCNTVEHLLHTTPELNYTPIEEQRQVLNLTNLDKLNDYERGRHVFLTSKDNVEDRPEWLGGAENIPTRFKEDVSDKGRFHPSHTYEPINNNREGGRSDAPAVLVTVNKGDGVVDAFWFFFYSYNLGNIVLNVRFGNHVGDWEHTLIRFQHGKPVAVYFSEHNFGSAYSYDAVEKIGKRPVAYSAIGTHAMYATAGAHPYILPLGLLHDQTDRGPLWDPALNALTYTYDHPTDTLRASNLTPKAPTHWFYYAGHWGDKFYPLDDKRQYGLVGEYHYVNGPLGPRFKHLGRRKVPRSPGVGEGEDWPDDPELIPLGLRLRG